MANNTFTSSLIRALMFIGVVGISYGAITENIMLIVATFFIPFVAIYFIRMIDFPIYFFYAIFVVNYLIIGINRYVPIPAISLIMDTLVFLLIALMMIHGSVYGTAQWRSLSNVLCLGCLIWTTFCFICIINPTGLVTGWLRSRALIYNPLVISIMTILIFTKTSFVKNYIFLLSVLSMLGVAKGIMQLRWGFDMGEAKWLAEGGSITHIISTGIRYFSFYSDASNFGANMAYTAFITGICAFYFRSFPLKVWYTIVCVSCLYAMFLSGTRSAMAIPLGGICAYFILSKNVKAMLVSGGLLMVIYVFFAFTYIGHGNVMIRRMRSTFRPTEDASFNVRTENQSKFAKHLKNRWFGEGLGLSGVENQDINMRFTTSIPTDSWLVKIWVETGLVGITLYLFIMLAIFTKCALIAMFKMKEHEMRGVFIGLIGGNFGLLIGSYANLFFGQYPTHFIVYIGFGIVMNYKYFNSPKEKIGPYSLEKAA